MRRHQNDASALPCDLANRATSIRLGRADDASGMLDELTPESVLESMRTWAARAAQSYLAGWPP